MSMRQFKYINSKKQSLERVRHTVKCGRAAPPSGRMPDSRIPKPGGRKPATDPSRSSLYPLNYFSTKFGMPDFSGDPVDELCGMLAEYDIKEDSAEIVRDVRDNR